MNCTQLIQTAEATTLRRLWRGCIAFICFGVLAAFTATCGLAQDNQPAVVEKDAAEGDANADELVGVEVQVVEEFANPFMANAEPAIEMLAAFAAAEAGLARRVCELSEEQDQQLRKLDRKWAKEQYREIQDSPVRGMVAGIARFLGAQAAGNANAAALNDPGRHQKELEKRTLERINAVLNEQQLQAVQTEREVKAELYQETLAEVLVHALDQKLHLSNEQLDKLQPVVKKWLGNRKLYWQFYFQNVSYAPDLPKRLLEPILSKSQLEALSNMNVYNYDSDNWNFQMQVQNLGVELIDQ